MKNTILAVILATAAISAQASEKASLDMGMKAFHSATDLEKSKLYLGACIQYRTALIHFSDITDKKFDKSKDTVRGMEQAACKKAGV